MKNIVVFGERLVTGLTNVVTILAGCCLLLTALMVFYEVVMRALFDAPTEWTLETSVYLVLIGGFLGLAATYADDKHIRVDLVISRLPESWQTSLNILTGFAGLIFGLILLVESYDMVLTSYELGRTSTSTLRVPLYLPQMALPIGALLLVLQFIRKIILDICRLQILRSCRRESKP